MFQLFKKDGRAKERLPVWILIVGAVVGIALLLFGGMGAKQQDSELPTDTPDANAATDAYRQHLEEEIRALCASLGVRDPCVVVTLSGSFEQVYATEQKSNGEEYVILGSGSTAHALLLAQNAPEIMGIGVICASPQNAALLDELVTLLATSFHTPSNRIYVTAPK